MVKLKIVIYLRKGLASIGERREPSPKQKWRANT